MGLKDLCCRYRSRRGDMGLAVSEGRRYHVFVFSDSYGLFFSGYTGYSGFNGFQSTPAGAVSMASVAPAPTPAYSTTLTLPPEAAPAPRNLSEKNRKRTKKTHLEFQEESF